MPELNGQKLTPKSKFLRFIAFLVYNFQKSVFARAYTGMCPLILSDIFSRNMYIFQVKWAEKLMIGANKSNYEIQIYSGLGHLIDLPFSPPTTISNHAMFPKPIMLEYGGTDVIRHGKAQEKIWQNILTFFFKHLQ